LLLVRKGPTSHLPLHYDTRLQTPFEIPGTEILGRIFIILFYSTAAEVYKALCPAD